MNRKLPAVFFVFVLPASIAYAQGAQHSAPHAASKTNTNCVPESTRLLTVEEHLKRLGCGFTQPLDIVQTFGAPLATDGFSQLLTSHAGYSGDINGFGEHYGVNLLGGLSSKFFGQFAFPAAFHQDDRYKRTDENTPAARRIGNIFKHLILTQPADENGHDVLNVAAIPNSLFCATLSNTYQPRVQRTAAASAQRFGWNLFGFSAGDAFSEFGPDLKKLGGKITSAFARPSPSR